MTNTSALRVNAHDLAWRLTDASLRASLDRLDPLTRRACGYHLGYWDADGSPGVRIGKGVRSTLALLSAKAAGVPAERAVPAAAACELVHNFSLVHDDVMDRDRERRHQPTVWAAFGTSQAILAGDALLALANELLSEALSPTVGWALRCLNATTRRLIAGQAADLAFETRNDVSLAECLAMIGDKTGALLACSASLGAVLVDAPAKLALGLADYGMHLGMAFQLTDDLLGIWGDPARTGKSVWSDLRARKKSVPVVAALESDDSAARELGALYHSGHELAEAELQRAAALVEEAGGRAWTQAEADLESVAAVNALADLDLPHGVRQELVSLTELLSRRDH
ncbi:MAG: polyprenyl synthetase family protein [Nocardioidaceae bacterium]